MRQKTSRGKNCVEDFCKKLKELGTEIIDYKEKDMIPSTDEEIKSYKGQNICHICKAKFCYDKNMESKFKRNLKVRDHCHYSRKFGEAVHNICNLRCKVPKKIPILSHNGSAYDWHVIIKQLAEHFEGQFECLGKNTEKYISFSVPIIKDAANDDGGKKEEGDDDDDDGSTKKKDSHTN